MNGWCQPHLSLRFALPPSMAGSHCGSSHCCLSRWVDHIHVDAPGPAPLRVQCCRAEESNGHLLRSGPHAVDKNPDLTSSAEGPQRFLHHSLSRLPATSPPVMRLHFILRGRGAQSMTVTQLLFTALSGPRHSHLTSSSPQPRLAGAVPSYPFAVGETGAPGG